MSLKTNFKTLSASKKADKKLKSLTDKENRFEYCNSIEKIKALLIKQGFFNFLDTIINMVNEKFLIEEIPVFLNSIPIEHHINISSKRNTAFTD